MTEIPMFIKRGRNKGKQVGYFETEDRTYYKIISYKANQMMQSPKHIGRIGISKTIIAQLQSYNCKKIKIHIVGYEKKSFFIIINLNDFIKYSKEENFDDPQLFVPMDKFIKIYPGQEELK